LCHRGLYTYVVLYTAVLQLIVLTPTISARALDLYALKIKMSKRDYNVNSDNATPSAGSRYNLAERHVNSHSPHRNNNNDRYYDRDNNSSRSRDRSISRSRSHHQVTNNNISLQFELGSNYSNSSARTQNPHNRVPANRAPQENNEQQIQQAESRSFNGSQNCTSRDNSNRRNNNRSDDYSGTCNSIPGTPHGTSLGPDSTTGLQSGTPHGTSHSGSDTNGNNLILSGSASANRLSNGTPMLSDTITTFNRTTENKRRRKKRIRKDPIPASSYKPTLFEETTAYNEWQNCYTTPREADKLPSFIPFVDSPEEIATKIIAANEALPSAILRYTNNNKEERDDDDNDSDYSQPFDDYEMDNDIPIAKISTFMHALPKNRVLSLGFNQKEQKHNGIYCPCCNLMSGWRQTHNISEDKIFTGETTCHSKRYTPSGILNHLQLKSYDSPFHHGALRYLQILYCNLDLTLRPCEVLPIPSSPSICQDITPSPLPTASIASRTVVDLSTTTNEDSVFVSSSIINNTIMSSLKKLLTCPITQDILEDPVQATDGNTYSRKELQQWMTRSQTSPLTREAMHFHDIKDNRIISQVLALYNEESGKKPAAQTVHIGSTRSLVPTIDVTTESIQDLNINTNSEVSPDNSPQEIITLDDRPATYDSFLSDNDVRLPSRHSPPRLDPTVGHASRHEPLRMENSSRHASRHSSASIVSGVTHASVRPFTAPSDTPFIPFETQRKRKNRRQKTNAAPRDKIKKQMKDHCIFLRSIGWLGDQANLRVNMPTTPSYSFMHSLEDGFEIVMYSCTHNTRLDGDLIIHKHQGTRLILGANMSLGYNEATLHGASKSREYTDENGNSHTQEDMCLFNYAWPQAQNNTRTRNAGTTDGIAREYGREVYREQARRCVCNQLHADPPSCLECLQPQNVIDLRTISDDSCDAGHVLAGNLHELGWVVVRGVRISSAQRDSIQKIAITGRGNDGTWHSADGMHPHLKMKYRHDTPNYKKWDEGSVKRYMECVLDTVVKRAIIPNGNIYCISRTNILKKSGVIMDDQCMHTDYPERRQE